MDGWAVTLTTSISSLLGVKTLTTSQLHYFVVCCLESISLRYASIQKRFALLPWLFSKATEIISVAFKSVSPVNDVEILLLYDQNYENTLKTRVNLDKAFWNGGDEAQMC